MGNTSLPAMRNEQAADAGTRTRSQMIVLAQLGHTAPHCAMVWRSEDTVACVLKRFLSGGLDAVPRRTSPGLGRTLTSARARRVVARV